jgi:SAM-dependent methyltransferase
MTQLCRHRDTCRLCGSRDLELVIHLAPTPVADDYVPAERLHEPQPAFPLDIWFCRRCNHTQLLDAVDPEYLFRNYTYVTSVSLGLVEHFRRSAEGIRASFPAAPGSLAVEIGSNDGSMLRFFRDAGYRVLGVDPAREIAARATAAGIETLPDFFSAHLGESIRRERGDAAVVLANNVYAHADDLGGITDGVRSLLAPDGVFVFEVSYMVDIVQRLLFDTVYHEHLCYHAVRPFVHFFGLHGLELFDVERIPTKGGSLRGFVQRIGGPRPVSPRVGVLVRLEEELGFSRAETFLRFAGVVEARRDQLLAHLDRTAAQGQTAAGYGASATVTTLLHHFDLGGRLAFLVDDNPVKQGTFSPGHHLPVLHPRALLERRPDQVVVLAWSYAGPIMEKNGPYREAGGRFVVPLPELTVVG